MGAATIPELTPMRRKALYNVVWRWHFYAGLFCMPFVTWLAITGSIYLWRPQLEALLDKPYDRLPVASATASPDAQVAAAIRAVPGSSLHQYVLPDAPGHAVRVLVTRGQTDYRVYVDPGTLVVLKVATEKNRPFQVLFHLHGELLAGATGSYLVEIAACWAIVMLLTGLYLWWPVGNRGLAGVLYPRLRGGRRLFWRDIHATAGIWVSLLALGLILSGLPWAKGWGAYLTEVRTLTGTSDGPVDWLIGGRAPTSSGTDEHAAHRGMIMPKALLQPGELARVIDAVRPLEVAPPVLLTPPTTTGTPWKVSSDAADRTLRTSLTVDGASGRITSRRDFGQRHWIDRAVGYGIAAHEGALFGLANQLLGTVTAMLLVMLTMSGTVMWWRRRRPGQLGAPPAQRRPRLGAGLALGIVALGIYMPMFGATLLAAIALEWSVLSRTRALGAWFGTGPGRTPNRV